MTSRSEQLEESRKAMDEESAIQTLNIIWGLKLALNIVLGCVFVYLLGRAIGSATLPVAPAIAMALVFVILATESAAIIAYYKKQPWSVYALHVFAAFSLLNFPIGTILSIVHFVNARKLRFGESRSTDTHTNEAAQAS